MYKVCIKIAFLPVGIKTIKKSEVTGYTIAPKSERKQQLCYFNGYKSDN